MALNRSKFHQPIIHSIQQIKRCLHLCISCFQFPIAVIQWITFVYSKRKPTGNNFRAATPGAGGTPCDGLSGEAPPVRGTFYRDEEQVETAARVLRFCADWVGLGFACSNFAKKNKRLLAV